jgi:arylsulfatase
VSGSVLFRVSERLSNEEVRVRYREEVEYVDREVGRLLAAVEAASTGRDTLVILTADHGEELGLHGPPGHVSRLYDSVLRVPLIISWPGQLPEGVVVSDPVSHIDLLPTITDLLNIRDLSMRSGRRLAPLLDSARADVEIVPIVAETFRPESRKDRKALIADHFKLILTPEDSLEELYDLSTDPDELHNLVSEDPEKTAEFTKILLARLAEAQARAPSPEQQTLTEEQLERLRSLGYVR